MIVLDFGKMCCVMPVFALATPVFADGGLSGQIDLGFRYYPEDGQYAGQGDAGFYEFLGLELEGTASIGPGDLVFQLSGVLDDALDRSFVNIEKLYYTQTFDTWDLVVGYNVEDWGVSSGRTIVNVLNSRDIANRVGTGGLIGTPMINANFVTEIGTFSAYAAFGDVIQNFGGPATRQRAPFALDDDFAVYEDENSVDLALRFSNDYAIGDGALDLSAYIYRGTSREAVALPGCTSTFGTVTQAICGQINDAIVADFENGGTQPLDETEFGTFILNNFPAHAADFQAGGVAGLTPYYQEISQVGLTAVYAFGDTQLRFEGYYRDTQHEGFAAGIIGGDHTLYEPAGLDGNLVLALEYHFDDRSARQTTSLFDNDLFLGANYTGNDRNGTQFGLGVFHDLDTSAQLYSLNASRRIGDRFRLGLDVSHVHADGMNDPLSLIDDDTFAEVTLSIFF